ncbi:MAG: hypothetical protein ISR65_00070 [Bacteriovoracaceae bacterium]|nr:hypothetical protein [Bacteriovoracaceae bacterium]
MDKELQKQLYTILTKTISESNGLTLLDTLKLLSTSNKIQETPKLLKLIEEFDGMLTKFSKGKIQVDKLLDHPIALGLFQFFKNFPLPYRDEHLHLTGSLSGDFIYPHLARMIDGPNKKIILKKIKDVYGDEPINSPEDITNLLHLKKNEYFERYLKILLIPKLILTTKQIHASASYTMAKELYTKFNIGSLRLKFTLSRETQNKEEEIPGIQNLTEEDVVLGLYDGFKKYQKENPSFNFILSPCFRKEANHYDIKFKSKQEHFLHQVDVLISLLDKYPHLCSYLTEVDTVGNEKELFRKSHFLEMRRGFRKLRFRGLKIRSHHGETWHSLKRGIQAVDNSMNIWNIDTLEHGLSLGINPNFYYHILYQSILKKNRSKVKIAVGSIEYNELREMGWGNDKDIPDKLIAGIPLSDDEITQFVKVKFHTSMEIEYYQHDILNRMINKQISLTSLPSSNKKLTDCYSDYKDHPFSWWEKKNVNLGVGTDNYVTLNTNLINELLIILFSDPSNLKIMKLLIIATGEKRRPYLSQLMWEMRAKL